MAWENKFIEYGVVIPDGNKLKVYGSQQFFITVNVNEPIASAMWQSDSIIVVLKSGKARKYTGFQFYVSL